MICYLTFVLKRTDMMRIAKIINNVLYLSACSQFRLGFLQDVSNDTDTDTENKII